MNRIGPHCAKRTGPYWAKRSQVNYGLRGLLKQIEPNWVSWFKGSNKWSLWATETGPNQIFPTILDSADRNFCRNHAQLSILKV